VRSSGDRGFTFTELLVAMVLAGVLGATAVSLFRAQSAAFRRENAAVEVEQNLRAGLDFMIGELRNAGMRDQRLSYADPPGFLTAEARAVRFTTDFRSGADANGAPDGDVVDPNEDVAYSFTSPDGTLRRETRGARGASGTQPLAEFVTEVSFTYLDGSGAVLASPVTGASLRAIRAISIRLSGAAPGGTPAATFEAAVAPRNLAYSAAAGP
jgi:prepilin-type N-terminal cleavage/methylation domain-containing protein